VWTASHNMTRAQHQSRMGGQYPTTTLSTYKTFQAQVKALMLRKQVVAKVSETSGMTDAKPAVDLHLFPLKALYPGHQIHRVHGQASEATFPPGCQYRHVDPLRLRTAPSPRMPCQRPRTDWTPSERVTRVESAAF
jgi:hypothetical protein